MYKSNTIYIQVDVEPKIARVFWIGGCDGVGRYDIWLINRLIFGWMRVDRWTGGLRDSPAVLNAEFYQVFGGVFEEVQNLLPLDNAFGSHPIKIA